MKTLAVNRETLRRALSTSVDGMSDAIAARSELAAVLAQPAEVEVAERWSELKRLAEYCLQMREGEWPAEESAELASIRSFSAEAFIAATTPTVVLELIAALSAVTAERDALAARLGEWERSKLAQIMRENVELTAERDRLQRNLNFTEQWYAERFERLADLGKSAGCWDAMAAIIANGTADPYEPPTYAQQLVRANHRADVAERERDQLRAEVERYVPLHEAVQRAAGELPEGWAIQLYIERDGGGVELIGPDGTEDFATNNERLDYTVIDALEAAMAANEA